MGVWQRSPLLLGLGLGSKECFEISLDFGRNTCFFADELSFVGWVGGLLDVPVHPAVMDDFVQLVVELLVFFLTKVYSSMRRFASITYSLYNSGRSLNVCGRITLSLLSSASTTSRILLTSFSSNLSAQMEANTTKFW